MKSQKFTTLILGFFLMPVCLISQSTINHMYFNPAPSYSFGTGRDFTPPSPHAASLGLYGQIPVGNFTGTAQITVPLHEVKYKGMTVPISINYHASGLKPDVFPGPLGTGWSLQAGGVITRAVNGIHDIGTPLPLTGQILSGGDFRGDDDWYSTSKLKQLTYNYTQLAFAQKVDPDEYYFNINGHTGSFYADHTDTMRVQSAQGGAFSIKMHTIQNIDARNITGFTITDSEGIKYIFGGGMATEINQPGLNFLSFYDPEMDLHKIVTYPSWFLIKMVSPNRDTVNFYYQDYKLLQRTRFMDLSSNGNNITYPASRYRDNLKCNFVIAPMIQEISTPAEKIVFSASSASKQLSYTPNNAYEYFPIPTDLSDFLYTESGDLMKPSMLHKPKKFDSFTVYDKGGNELKKVSFIFFDSDYIRLRLQYIEMRMGVSEKVYSYGFEYNEPWLCHYLTEQTDHYGYYNGRGLFTDEIKNRVNEIYNNMKETDFNALVAVIEAAKQPDPDLTQAEMLNKITYPTGGYTTFEYEQHNYGSRAKTWPFETENNPNGNQITGGVRIKKICNYNHSDELLTEKKYHYVKNFQNGGTVSSGVLAYKPVYAEFFKNRYLFYQDHLADKRPKSFFRITSNPIYPLSPHGNHITYSEVAVEETGNGFTVYKYKNHDNGYGDIEPYGYVSDVLSSSSSSVVNPIEYWKHDEGISMALERGQLMSEEVYDSGKNLKKKTVYTYNNDENRFNEHVRYLRHVSNGFNITGYKCYRTSAGVRFTYFPYLKEKEETENGITTKTAYKYNSRYRLIKEIKKTNSDITVLETKYQYPFDKTGQNVYSEMVNRFMLAYPTEKSNYVNNTLLHKEYYDYALNKSEQSPLLILIDKVRSQYKNQTSKTEITYVKYDLFGNPNEIRFRSGESVVYLWSYKGQYPVVEIKNATYAEITGKIPEATLNAIATRNEPTASDLTAINNLRTQLPHALITTYTYKPLVGILTMTDPRGVKTVYEYDSFGRLKDVKIGAKNTPSGSETQRNVESYDYHYKNQ